jgi:hypothetical protein
MRAPEQDEVVAAAALARAAQRHLTPFLASEDVEARLRAVADAGALATAAAGARYRLRAALRQCLYAHPAFFEAREARSAAQEGAIFGSPDPGHDASERRYAIEQIVNVRDDEVPECSAIDLFVSTPRHVPGVQHVRLVDCQPALIRDHFHPRAGLLHGVPLVFDPGRVSPRLRLVFEVVQPAGWAAKLSAIMPYCPPLGAAAEDPVATWLAVRPGARAESASATVDAVVYRVERELVHDPAPATVAQALAQGAADAGAFAAVVAQALRHHSIMARVEVGQRLQLEDGAVELRFPGGQAFDHAYVRWYDPATGERGVVDPVYRSRWADAATDANAPGGGRARFDTIGRAARRYLRSAPYPLDFVLSAKPPPSQLSTFLSGDRHGIRPPLDTALHARRVEAP